MCPATLVTLNMRELNRLKVIQAIVKLGLEPTSPVSPTHASIPQCFPYVARYSASPVHCGELSNCG